MEEREPGGLWLAVRRGQPEAFGQLSARYAGLVRAKAARFAGPSAPEQEDLLQEGFLALYAAALTYDPQAGASFATYAGVCVYNRMADAARRHHSPGNRTLNESLPLDAAGSLPAAPGPEGQYELKESFLLTWRQWEELLSPLERQALGLFLSGCPRDQVQARAGMDQKVFDNALYRVRAKLRKLRELSGQG